LLKKIMKAEKVTSINSDEMDASTARVSYFDVADRDIVDENIGTNGGSAWTRPSTPDARDADHLVTSATYNDQGLPEMVTDPNGLVTKTIYDLLGRQTRVIADYTDGTPTDSSNQTADYAYDGDNHLINVTALLPNGQPSQTTDYLYGVTTRME
jgi:uncharacterized protein RhaS with RHS repeats